MIYEENRGSPRGEFPFSKPSPSATRPPHRGEKPKYMTRFELRGAPLSPRLSLKLSLPRLRTGSERRRLRRRTDHQKGGGSFRRLLIPQVVGAGQLPRTSCCPLLGTIERPRRRARDKMRVWALPAHATVQTTGSDARVNQGD